jgi:predicted transcriptional regulator
MFVPDRILALLAERPRLSVAAIRAALPDCKRVAITTALLRLEEKGLIEPVGWRAYRLTSRPATPHPVQMKDFRT